MLDNLSLDEVLKMDIFYLFLTIVDYSINNSNILKYYIYSIESNLEYYNDSEKCFDYKGYGYKYRPITITAYFSYVNFFIVNKEEINGYFIHFLPLLKYDLGYKEMLTLDSIYSSLEKNEIHKIEEIVLNLKKIYRNDIVVENILVNMEYNIIYDLIKNIENLL